MNNVQEKIENSRTFILKAVFPNTTNHYDTLFGGTAMQLMDKTAFIAATQFSRRLLVTVISDKIGFTKPNLSGNIIELDGYITKVGSTNLKMRLSKFIEESHICSAEKTVSDQFGFVTKTNRQNFVTVYLLCQP